VVDFNVAPTSFSKPPMNYILYSKKNNYFKNIKFKKMNNFIYFHVLVKHNLGNSEKYAFLFLILIEKIEYRFLDFSKHS